MSAAAVLRCASHALRRPPFSRAVIERRPPHRFYSSDSTAVGKQEGATTVARTWKDGFPEHKLDKFISNIQEQRAVLKEYKELMLEESKRERRTIAFQRAFLLVLGAVYVKRRFFGGAAKDKQDVEQQLHI